MTIAGELIDMLESRIGRIHFAQSETSTKRRKCHLRSKLQQDHMWIGYSQRAWRGQGATHQGS